MSYLDREPDLDLPTFRLWAAKPSEEEPEVDEGSVLIIDFSAEEKIYEQRVYGGWKGYYLALLSKTRPDGKIWVMLKGKRPDGESFVVGRKEEWMTEAKYHRVVAHLEASELSVTFDMEHPQITKGRAMNIYMKGGNK